MNNAGEETYSEIIGFQEEIASIQTAIADFESGNKSNLAIIAEPFAGRTTLVNEIDRRNPQKVTRLFFSSFVKNKDEAIIPEKSKRIIIIDQCEFLYTRKIGGFDILEDFLKSMVSSNYMFITTWNLYSWNYLDEVIKISKFFPVRIELKKLTMSQIKECILSRYKEDEIKFIEDIEFEKEKVIKFMKYPLIIKPLKKTINVPYFKVNYGVLKVKILEKEEKFTIQDIIFEKIYNTSGGNPGVAKVIWKKSLEYPVIKPSRVKEFSFKIELDYKESFILSYFLSMKSIKKEDLAEIVGSEFQIDEILFRLVKQGLIAMDDDGAYGIRPEGLRSIAEFLKKLRLVW